LRAAELQERLTRLGAGETPAPQDVAAGHEHVADARRRLKAALLRSSEAHRSAAATALRAGKSSEADRHLGLAELDTKAAAEMDGS
jgi:hypothetical protein